MGSFHFQLETNAFFIWERKLGRSAITYFKTTYKLKVIYK